VKGARRALLAIGLTTATLTLAVGVRADVPPLVAQPEEREELRAELASPRFRFCNDANYRLWREDKDALCGSLEQLKSVCPALPAACARPPWEDAFAREDDSIDFAWLIALLKELGPVATATLRVALWVAALVVLALLGRALARRIAALRAEERALLTVGPRAPLPGSAAELALTTPARALLEQAEQALGAGRPGEALHLTYAAVVRALGDAALVAPHRSKTAGDYARALSSAPARPGSVAVGETPELLRALDRARYRSGLVVSEAEALFVRARAELARFTPLLVALLGLGATSCDLPSIPEAPHSPTAPRGIALFESLLNSRAPSVNRRLRRVTSLPEETSTVVALEPSLRELEWRALERFVSRGGHLVLALPATGFVKGFGVSVERADCAGHLERPSLSLPTLVPHQGLSLSLPHDVECRCAAATYAAALPYGEGRITLLGDARLFENAVLASGDHVSLALGLLGELDGHVELLGPWTGRGSLHPLESISRAGLLPWLAHLLLLLALYGWAAGRRFGRPVDPPVESRRALSDHARALARHYASRRAAGHALAHLAEWTLDELRRRSPSGRGDARALSRAVTREGSERALLQRALTVGPRASELGLSDSELLTLLGALRRALGSQSPPSPQEQASP
jgi:hypothetical protein